MKLLVGKIGDSQEVPGSNPIHAFALAVGSEFNRLKGQVGREHNAILVGKSTPFGQLHDSAPFKPGDTAIAVSQRPVKQGKQQEEKPATGNSGAVVSAGVKNKKGTAAAAVLSSSAPFDMSASTAKRPLVNPADLSKKELENLRVTVRFRDRLTTLIDSSLVITGAGVANHCPWRAS